MKKLIAISAIVIMIVLALTGCKKAESSANGDTPMPGNVFSCII